MSKRPRQDTEARVEKRARVELKPIVKSAEHPDTPLIVCVRRLLEYIRLSGIYNMYTEHEDATLSALLYGLAFGELTEHDIWKYFNHSGVQDLVQESYFNRSPKEQKEDEEYAQCIPYPFVMENPTSDSSVQKKIEMLRVKALERGKFARDTGTRTAQIYNNDKRLMWVGLQLLTKEEVQ